MLDVQHAGTAARPLPMTMLVRVGTFAMNTRNTGCKTHQDEMGTKAESPACDILVHAWPSIRNRSYMSVVLIGTPPLHFDCVSYIILHRQLNFK